MDKEASQDAYKLEICNTNSSSQIVFNDLRFLEVLYLHPFLISQIVRGHGDEDYEEWGWQQVANCFNASYEQEGLNPFYSAEELQRRWETLKPLCLSFEKEGNEMTEPLSNIISKINVLLWTKRTRNFSQQSRIFSMQALMLQQLGMVERLTEDQRKLLEVEILDTILKAKRNLYHRRPTKIVEDTAMKQYDKFLCSIRVKELPPDAARVRYFTPHQEAPTIPITAPELIIKDETPNPPYVPFKDVKKYIKKFRVKLKRLDSDKYANAEARRSRITRRLARF